MKPIHVWILFAVLFVLHHDFWWWNDRGLVLGFMPVGLAWHVLFSIAAAGLWLLALKFAWPQHIEEWAEVSEPDPTDTAATTDHCTGRAPDRATD